MHGPGIEFVVGLALVAYFVLAIACAPAALMFGKSIGTRLLFGLGAPALALGGGTLAAAGADAYYGSQAISFAGEIRLAFLAGIAVTLVGVYVVAAYRASRRAASPGATR